MLTILLDRIAHLVKDGETITGRIFAIFGESQHGFSVAIADDKGKIHIGWGSQLTLANEKDYYFVKPEKLPRMSKEPVAPKPARRKKEPEYPLRFTQD